MAEKRYVLTIEQETVLSQYGRPLEVIIGALYFGLCGKGETLAHIAEVTHRSPAYVGGIARALPARLNRRVRNAPPLEAIAESPNYWQRTVAEMLIKLQEADDHARLRHAETVGENNQKEMWMRIGKLAEDMTIEAAANGEVFSVPARSLVNLLPERGEE